MYTKYLRKYSRYNFEIEIIVDIANGQRRWRIPNLYRFLHNAHAYTLQRVREMSDCMPIFARMLVCDACFTSSGTESGATTLANRRCSCTGARLLTLSTPTLMRCRS